MILGKQFLLLFSGMGYEVISKQFETHCSTVRKDYSQVEKHSAQLTVFAGVKPRQSKSLHLSLR